MPVWLVCEPRRGPPHAAGLDPVGVGGCVAHGLEGVAPGGEVLRTVGDEFELAGLDLGAVLLALEVAESRHQLVRCPVETLGLAVEHVDEAPHQALALVGELEPVRADAPGEDAEGFEHRVDGVVGVPDVAGVELVTLGGGAVEGRVLADCRRDGLGFAPFDVLDDGHDDLLDRMLHLSERLPRGDVLLGTARATEPPGPE